MHMITNFRGKPSPVRQSIINGFSPLEHRAKAVFMIVFPPEDGNWKHYDRSR